MKIKSRIKTKLTALAAALLLGTATLAYAQQHDDHATKPPHPAATTPKPHEGDPAGAPHGTEHGAEHGTEHTNAGHHGPEAINWTDISDKTKPAFLALAVNFGLLVAIYFAMGKKPVVEGLKQRRIDIGKDIEDAARMLAEAKERAKKYQADLKNADVDAATAKASLVSSGKGEVERLLTEAEEKAERMKRDAERLVEQEQKQLKADLTRETIDRAVIQAHEILEKNATSEDHARLAQELLAELAQKPAAKRVGGPAAGSIRPSSTGGGAA